MTDKVSRAELESVESEWVSNPSPILCARFSELLRRAGRLDESRKTATGGLKRWKNHISITVVLGKCFRDAGLNEKALETFMGVHAVQPQNLVALRNLAEIHCEKGQWSKAADYFEEYLFEHPGDEEVRERLEEAKTKKNSSDEVLQDIEEDNAEPDAEVFPNTERMNKVLESQGIDKETDNGSDENEAIESLSSDISRVEPTSFLSSSR